jgi:hypothetical protein
MPNSTLVCQRRTIALCYRTVTFTGIEIDEMSLASPV